MVQAVFVLPAVVLGLAAGPEVAALVGVVLLTCGQGQCSSTKLLRALALRVKKNLYKLPAQKSEDD